MHLRELDANLIVILDALLLEASVTKAAQRLGRSPSAVSHALARLREVFDDPLFVRAGQRLVPTSRATQLAPTVHVIVSGLEGLLNNERNFEPEAQERSFVLACRPELELTLLAAVRAALASAAPGITLHQREADGVVDALRTGRIDLAIVDGEAEPSANDISAERLYDEPFVALAPERQSAKTLWLNSDDSPLLFTAAGHVTHLFDGRGHPQPATLEAVASPLIAIHAALARQGIALVPASVATLAARHMATRSLTTSPALPSIPHHLIWHLSKERDACHAWLRDHLRRCAKGVTQTEPPEPVPA
ncbi:LysR family transcriptional regulator [Dichotomicrobium thermohalophilum]|uniref:LysR family transcriptional regulator n=1 Tax=Dichotomicrobium thermohalophilum TaxID=933063 RepID=A0A397QA90_9HYPH|nr:LysR family transcriptional regulator [Dichotomicrobium thermohalophilum]RIA55044.1 LysR family transcriptional regulator [Dichotomicrobium thermohalophilum]